MANRTFAAAQYCSDKDVVILFADVAFNGSSAPTLLQCALNSTCNYTAAPAGGTTYVKSFVRNSQGNYTVTLRDTYVRLRGLNVMFVSNSNAAGPIIQVKVASDPTNSQAFGTNTAAGTVRGAAGAASTVNFLIFSAQGTLADPGATEFATIEIILQNSTAL